MRGRRSGSATSRCLDGPPALLRVVPAASGQTAFPARVLRVAMSRRALRRLRGEWRGQGLLGEETPVGGPEARGSDEDEDEEVAGDQLPPVSGGGRRRRGPRREPLERVANPFELVRLCRGPAGDPQQPGVVPLPFPAREAPPERLAWPWNRVCPQAGGLYRGAGASWCLSRGWVAAPAHCGWLRSVGSAGGVSPKFAHGRSSLAVSCWWKRNCALVWSSDPVLLCNVKREKEKQTMAMPYACLWTGELLTCADKQ